MSWIDFTNQVLWDSPASDQIIIYPDFEDEDEPHSPGPPAPLPMLGPTGSSPVVPPVEPPVEPPEETTENPLDPDLQSDPEEKYDVNQPLLPVNLEHHSSPSTTMTSSSSSPARNRIARKAAQYAKKLIHKQSTNPYGPDPDLSDPDS